MKHLSIKQLLAISTLAIALPFSALSHAEPGHSDASKDCGRHDAKRGHGFHGIKHGGNWGEPGVPHYFKALNLTQDQQDKIFAITHEQAPVKYTQHKQHREALEALRTLAQADKFDEAKAQQLADQLGKLEKEKVLSRLKTEAKINAVLTPEQRAKAREFKAAEFKRPRGGWDKDGRGRNEPAGFKQKSQQKPLPEAKPVNS